MLFLCISFNDQLTKCFHIVSFRMALYVTWHIENFGNNIIRLRRTVFSAHLSKIGNVSKVLRCLFLDVLFVSACWSSLPLLYHLWTAEWRGEWLRVGIYLFSLVYLWGFLVKHVWVRLRRKLRHPGVSRTDTNKLPRTQRHWCFTDFLYTDKIHASGISDPTQKWCSLETLCHSAALQNPDKNYHVNLSCKVNVNNVLMPTGGICSSGLTYFINVVDESLLESWMFKFYAWKLCCVRYK